MRTLVIIPTYNECDNVAIAIRGALAQSERIDVLVVDDGSPDGTGDIADTVARENAGRVYVAHRQRKLGLGTAYLAGFRFGIDRGYDAVCEMDADGSHDPTSLTQLIAAVESGAGLSVGSRRVTGGRVIGWGLHRHVMSNGAMWMSRLALGLRTRDVTSGFRCYRADVARHLLELPIESNGYAFQEETLFYVERAGFTVFEIPIIFRDRRRGHSKLTWREAAQFFAVIGRLRKARHPMVRL